MLKLDSVQLEQGGFTLSANFTIKAQQKVAVLGPSGAGKSTLLAAIAGFLAPASGRVIWDGADLTSTEPGQRPLSMVFQDNNLFPHLTAFQNVALGLSPSLKLNSSDRARVLESLDRVGLSGLDARKPGALSGGQQGRVALARVLLRARPLLLLDEPFSALGPALKSEMLDLVAQLCADTGATLLMVTHDPGDARRLADETVFVADGVAHAPVATHDLLDNPPPALSGYLGQT